eukprot:CAMPEP_0117555216 /NCGR_PEP_ID=MMETSP0784-20121206/51161_1 /TAXON_ID=39447 /ORGANISM="" /LENGTH=341 /DNA_ID=CAMNT_0005352417 /DNA_START=68 /DNA_END=1093 /DNA_ORIENTATION=-
MALEGHGQLRVRSISGTILLTITRSESQDLNTLDLKRRLLDITGCVISDGLAPALVGLQVCLGSILLEDTNKLEAHWTDNTDFLDLDLIVQKAKGEDDINLGVLYLLDKEGPFDINPMVECLTRMELQTPWELCAVTEAIISKSFSRPENSEAYADLASALVHRFPKMPFNLGGRPATFQRALLGSCQQTFENLTTELKQVSLLSDLIAGRSACSMLFLMRFLGHLFTRQFFGIRIIGQIVHDLIAISKDPVSDFSVECICELLEVTATDLDSTKYRKVLMGQFRARLRDGLKSIEHSDHIHTRLERLLTDPISNAEGSAGKGQSKGKAFSADQECRQGPK